MVPPLWVITMLRRDIIYSTNSLGVVVVWVNVAQAFLQLVCSFVTFLRSSLVDSSYFVNGSESDVETLLLVPECANSTLLSIGNMDADLFSICLERL